MDGASNKFRWNRRRHWRNARHYHFKNASRRCVVLWVSIFFKELSFHFIHQFIFQKTTKTRRNRKRFSLSLKTSTMSAIKMTLRLWRLTMTMKPVNGELKNFRQWFCSSVEFLTSTRETWWKRKHSWAGWFIRRNTQKFQKSPTRWRTSWLRLSRTLP